MAVSPVRLAIVAGDFHKTIAHEMVAAATTEANRLGATVTHTVYVPGSYELPLTIESLLRHPDIDAAVALGYIERGETLHGIVLGQVVHQALLEISLKYNKPIGLGIIGPGATAAQAEARKITTAAGATAAAVRSAITLRSLSKQ